MTCSTGWLRGTTGRLILAGVALHGPDFPFAERKERMASVFFFSPCDGVEWPHQPACRVDPRCGDRLNGGVPALPAWGKRVDRTIPVTGGETMFRDKGGLR